MKKRTPNHPIVSPLKATLSACLPMGWLGSVQEYQLTRNRTDSMLTKSDSSTCS